MEMNIRQYIHQFVDDFGNIILEDHAEAIFSFLKMLQENEERGDIDLEESVNENHFRSCPWSYGECEEGPDTCRCTFFYLRKANVLHTIDSYYKTFSFIIN